MTVNFAKKFEKLALRIVGSADDETRKHYAELADRFRGSGGQHFISNATMCDLIDVVRDYRAALSSPAEGVL